LEHYIVSSGIYEMIHGSPIAKFFTQIYASKFYYKDGIAKWPSVSINYTTKTNIFSGSIKGSWKHGTMNL